MLYGNLCWRSQNTEKFITQNVSHHEQTTANKRNETNSQRNEMHITRKVTCRTETTCKQRVFFTEIAHESNNSLLKRNKEILNIDECKCKSASLVALHYHCIGQPICPASVLSLVSRHIKIGTKFAFA